VCQTTDPSSRYYAPEADHPKLKLAHTVGGSVEILKRVDVTDFLHCTGVSASVAPSGWRGSLSRLLPGVSVAYAAHGGLGGKVKSFSPFGAVLDACGDTTGLTLGVTTSGTLEPSDCQLPQFGSSVNDLYKFSLANQSILRLVTAGDNALRVTTQALIDQPEDENLVSVLAIPQSQYIILPPGNYWMAVNPGVNAGLSGSSKPYSLTMQTVAAVTGCPITQSNQQTYVYPGTVLNASVANDDCPTTVQGLFGDNYWIQMVPSRTYQISATATIGLRIELVLCCSSTIPVRFASAGSGTVSITYQPPSSGLYVVNVIGNTPSNPTGPYTLSVTKQ
jgi:hypothetical protein